VHGCDETEYVISWMRYVVDTAKHFLAGACTAFPDLAVAIELIRGLRVLR
jgi:hypothetical protein